MAFSTNKTRSVIGKGLLAIACTYALGLTSAPFALADGRDSSDSSPVDDSILNVSVAEDGSITSIGSDDTSGKSFDPAASAHDLPVRVLTSWTTDGKSGSDLRRVVGASGKVQVDLSLQNVTGKVENVSVDASGESLTRAQLVATPFTVVASTRLDSVSPEQVITGEPGTAGVTNGVVSVDDEETVVQWAATLAPPVLAGDVTFSLVLDVENFTVPEINIAAAPGFGLNSLQEDGGKSDVVAQTISTLSDVGMVLAESGKSLTTARAMLTDAGNQIGSRTISDLTASNDRILASAKALSQALNSLDQSLTGELSSAGETITSELSATTQRVNGLLGNPDVKTPGITVDSYTCDIKKIDVSEGNDTSENEEDEKQRRLKDAMERNGVYGVVSELSARLDAYADASEVCQTEISSNLDKLLGPDEPDEEICSQNDSLSCSLWETQRDLVEVSNDLAEQGAAISNLLAQEPVKESFTAAVTLGEAMTDLDDKISVLEHEQPGANLDRSIRAIRNSFRNASRELSKLKGVVDSLHSDLSATLQTADMQDQRIRQTKLELCVASGQTIPEGESEPLEPQIDTATVDLFLESFATHRCPTTVGAEDGRPLRNGKNSVQGLGNTQRASIEQAVAQTAPYTEESDNSALAQAVKSMEERLVEADEAVQSLIDAKNGDTESIEAQIKEVKGAFRTANRSYAEAYKLLEAMNSSYMQTQEEVASTFDETSKQLKQDADENYDSGLEIVNTVREDSKKQSDKFFGKIGEDLKGTSKEMRDSSGGAIRATKKEVEELNTALGQGTRESLNTSSQRMNEMLSSAVLDSDAAGELLSADIKKVLNDIGTNDSDSTGLLGAMAASNGQLGIADEKMTTSTTQMSQYQLLQRSRFDEFIMRQGVLQASLARLENIPGFPVEQPDVNPHVFTFQVATGDNR